MRGLSKVCMACVAAGGVLALALGLTQCSPSKPASSPSASDVARAEVRAVVETAESVWLLEAQACVDTQNAGEISVCDAVLTPIRDVLIEAGGAVDTWTDADQGNLPCMLADIKTALVNTHDMLGVAAPKAQIYNDLLTLVQSVNITCTVDGGAKKSAVM